VTRAVLSLTLLALGPGGAGEVDRAFEWLERAYSQRDPGLTEMKVSSRFRSLHSDPRWGAFLKKMGLEG
jgi:hypothetical protein